MSERESLESPIAEPEPTAPQQQRWILGTVVAALLGLLLYLAIQYTGPSTVSDDRLEADAIEAIEDGRALEAAAHYAELAERSMDTQERASWMLEQASALVQAEQGSQAIAVLSSASELDIGDEDLRQRILLRLGELYITGGDRAAALALYIGIADDDGISPEYLSTALIGVLDATESSEDGEQGWGEVGPRLLRHPDHPEIALAVATHMAEVLMARERGADALTALELLPGEDWDPLEQARWLLARARVVDDMQDLEASLALYSRALEVVGEEGDVATLVRFEVASVRARRGDLATAREQLEELDGDVSGELACHVKLLLAEVLRQQGDPEAAEAHYRAVIEGWPAMEDAVATAREGLGALLLASEGGELAIEELFAAIEAGTGDPATSLDVLLGHANALLGKGQAELALASFERIRALTEDGGHWATAADHGRASALIQLDRNTDALELLRELRSQCDAAQRLLIDAQIGETLLQSGQLSQAQDAFESLLEVSEELGHSTAPARLGLAGVAEAQERFEQAIHLYKQVASSEQDAELQVAALQGLASVYQQLERDEDAILAYRQLADRLPADSPALVTVRMSMAEVHARTGEIERERAIWTALIEQVGSEAGARARIRLVELDMAEAAEAGDAVGMEAALAAMRALRDDPAISDAHRPDVVYGEVVCLFELGRFEQAIELIDQAVEQGLAGPEPEVFETLKGQAVAALAGEPLDPDLADLPEPGDGPTDQEMEALLARVAEAVALRDQGSFDSALASFDELLGVIEDRPTQASILREVAQTQAAVGDLEAARATLQRCLQDYADLDEAGFLAQLALADLDLREADASSALARLDGLAPPDDGHALWRLQVLARAHATAGDSEAALRTWREAIELAEGDPAGSVLAWTGLGDLYLQLGESKHASDAFQRASVLAPEGPARVQSRLRAAQVSVETGRLEEAQDMLDEIGLEELDAELTVQVALARSALAQERGAWDLGIEAVAGLSVDDIGPDYEAQVVDARGVCLLSLGRVDEAGEAYRKLAERWPEHPEVDAVSSFGLAEAAAASGDLSASAEIYQDFVTRCRDRFRQGQALLRLGQLYENHGEAELAKQTYKQVAVDYADEPELAASAAAALD